MQATMVGTNYLAGVHVDYFYIIGIIIRTTWPLWALIAVIALGKLVFQLWEKQRLAKSGHS
jgi:hypothetical protein